MHYRSLVHSFFMLILLLGLSGAQQAAAQQPETHSPIDMMILIDNSCSMFPANRIIAGCDAYGSDPGYLRITGADLFIARLGFGEPDEKDYRLGVISVGKKPNLISPLQLLSDQRDALAAKIANPSPENATALVPSLEQAYTELTQSSNRKATNLPAIVLITDGIPWPQEGQGYTDIEALVSKNPDIPLFVMLLENQEQVSDDYKGYIEFWDRLQSTHTSIFVYHIKDAGQIQATYNQILAQLQGTVPSEAADLQSNSELKFTVQKYVQSVLLTVIHPADALNGQVKITDPLGTPVNNNEPGVVYFRGKENPVEVISIGPPRLSDELKGKEWTITSDKPVTVIIDRGSSYQINILNPKASRTEITNIYKADEVQTPNREITLKFNLLDQNGSPVTDPQSIQINVVSPDGTTASIGQSKSIVPDANGTYSVKTNLTPLFPGIADQPGRYTFVINSGISDTQSGKQIPVTTVQVLMDIGRIPYFQSLDPALLVCKAGEPAKLQVTVGDIDPDSQKTIGVMVKAGDQVVELGSDGNGVFSGDLQSLCAQSMQRIRCSDQQPDPFQVILQQSDGKQSALPVSSGELKVQALGVECTPTSQPTFTVTPAPTGTPTPIPDHDQDGVNDLQDRCPAQAGSGLFGGCSPWGWVFGGSGGILVLFGLVTFVWPFVQVRTVAPPPKAYLRVIRDGKPDPAVIDLYQAGRSRNHSRIVVGGRRRGTTVYIPGLKAIEFYIEKKDNLITVRDASEKEPFVYFDRGARIIRTSDPKVILRVSLDPEQL